MASEPRPSDDAVRTHIAVLHDHLSDRITLGDLTRITAQSQYAVLRAFRRAVGIPPHRYLTQLRIQRAAQLLRAGRPPSAVAIAVGLRTRAI